jgi:hypothetical protein
MERRPQWIEDHNGKKTTMDRRPQWKEDHNG